MRRYAILLAVCVCLAIAPCATVAALHARGAPAPVYSIAAINRHLGPVLPRWLQEPVRVRAYAECGPRERQHCKGSLPVLVDESDLTSTPLPLMLEPALSPLLGWLPIPNTWLPRLPEPHWWQRAEYRIAVVEIPFDATVCLRRPCYAARLVATWR